MKAYLSLISIRTKLKCVGVIILAAVSAMLASIWPIKLGELYTGISSGMIRTIAQGAIPVLNFGLIYLASECLTITRRVMLECIVATHESEIRELSIEKLLKMPMAYYTEGLSGEKTARLNQGVAGLSQLMKIMCNDVFATLLTAFCTLIQVFLRANSIMVILMLLYLALTVAVSVCQIRSQNGIRESIVNKKNQLNGQICQSITNIELIRGMNAENYEKTRLLPAIRDICSAEKCHHRFMGRFDVLKQGCKIMFQIGLLVVSIVLISCARMDPGSVIAVCLLFQQLVKPIDDVYRFMDETAASLIKSKALLEVVFCDPDDVFNIKSNDEIPHGSSIHLEDVIVTTPGKDKPLAWYEDLTIPCGVRVALTGASGCGKTTLIRALMRIYPHTRGRIELFGRPLDSYSQAELASLLYCVPQSTFFFAGTVRENLVYGLERRCPDNELMEALRRSILVGSGEGCLGETEAILESRLSECAANLSGGQRQRLALARAFLRQPKIYIFDESTTNLDKNTIAMVLENIESYAHCIGAGIIYISHDRAVIDHCDIVISVENQLTQYCKLKRSA